MLRMLPVRDSTASREERSQQRSNNLMGGVCIRGRKPSVRNAVSLLCLNLQVEIRDSFLEHRVAPRFELVARLPFRNPLGIRHAIPNEHQQFSVLRGAGAIPVRLNLIRRLVVVVVRVLVALLLAERLVLPSNCSPVSV